MDNTHACHKLPIPCPQQTSLINSSTFFSEALIWLLCSQWSSHLRSASTQKKKQDSVQLTCRVDEEIRGRSREEPTWSSWHLSGSCREALVQLGGRGCRGGAQLGGWHGLIAALPCPSTPGSPHWRRPFCSHPPAPYSCSFESPAWEAADASLCSLFRPLSSPWRQPCSSLGRLINSIINAERKESPRSFLMATHAPEYKRQADRKQGLVPGDAPLPASGALHLPMPSWTTWPHLPGQPLTACEGRVREGVACRKPVWRYPHPVDKPCSEQWVQV